MKKQIMYTMDNDRWNSSHLLQMIEAHLKENGFSVNQEKVGYSIYKILDSESNYWHGRIEQSTKNDSNEPYIHTIVSVEMGSKLEKIMDFFRFTHI